ncbi:hypothetical protein HBB16_06410 [Pseudonocardia sp. MCCB 268]|nr:hypothetical protein [Pseudonocardia cytotoxica]
MSISRATARVPSQGGRDRPRELLHRRGHGTASRPGGGGRREPRNQGLPPGSSTLQDMRASLRALPWTRATRTSGDPDRWDEVATLGHTGRRATPPRPSCTPSP